MRSAADFDDFYTSCGPILVRQLYLLTGNHEEARDCVQEAMMRAWTRWSEVSTLEEPMAWVRLVARRLAVSRWRKARNAVAAIIRSHSDEHGEDESGKIVIRDELVAALQALPVKQRTAVVLHYLCDLDLATIAEETHLSVSAVKSQLFRGRAALAEKLQQEATIAGPMAAESGNQSEVTW